VGQKVHPIGFRLGVTKDWASKWYAGKKAEYADLLHEDIAIRKAVLGISRDAGIARVEIDRWSNQITVTIHTARPGIVIGRGGQRVEELRRQLEAQTGKRIRLNIHELRYPEIEAQLVARSIADQIERRVSYRRAMSQAVQRALQRGALGIKVRVSGRLGGAEIARSQTERSGRVPLHTLRANIDYGFTEANTAMGRIGVKVWIYKGDVVEARSEIRVAEPEA
jgi:small subunit ribosomal protein S3